MDQSFHHHVRTLTGTGKARAISSARLFSSAGASAEQIGSALHTAMFKALSRLDEQDQLALALHYLEEFSNDEIALTLGITCMQAQALREQAMERVRASFFLIVARDGGQVSHE